MRSRSDRFPDKIPVVLERFERSPAPGGGGPLGNGSLGNDQVSFADPVTVMVTGVGPPTLADAELAGHDRITVDAVLYASDTIGFADKDRVTVEARTYEVVGGQSTVRYGPFWDLPRVSVRLKEVHPR